MTVSSTDEPLPAGTEGRLEKFTELLATAIANAESRSELAASRRRIVAASDEARRRIERDLHDGTQQRLVSLALAARAALADVAADPGDLRAELSRVAAGVADAMKHARASRIEMSLTTRDGSLLLSVRDDGVGGADPASGSGLAGLADRVEALGGSIHVRSAAGAGTLITVDLPLEYELAQGAG